MKNKVVICFFGVIPRSIRYTYKSIHDNIIEILKKEYDVDIFVFNMKHNYIDNVEINQNDIHIIPFTFFEEIDQNIFDTEFEKNNNNIEHIFYYKEEYIVKNAFRQLYSEYRISLFLKKHIDKYKGALVCGPDFFIANTLNINEIHDAFQNKDRIYIPCMNDALGYTNGFYFGSVETIIQLTSRYDNILKEKGYNKDYEFYVKQYMDKHNIQRCISNIVFFKIRANKSLFWAEWNRENSLQSFHEHEKKQIIDIFNSLHNLI